LGKEKRRKGGTRRRRRKRHTQIWIGFAAEGERSRAAMSFFDQLASILPMAPGASSILPPLPLPSSPFSSMTGTIFKTMVGGWRHI
jgi:hypothetical protein